MDFILTEVYLVNHIRLLQVWTNSPTFLIKINGHGYLFQNLFIILFLNTYMQWYFFFLLYIPNIGKFPF